MDQRNNYQAPTDSVLGSLDDIRRQFPAAGLGANFLSYENSMIFDQRDRFTDYARVHEANVMPLPPDRNTNRPPNGVKPPPGFNNRGSDMQIPSPSSPFYPQPDSQPASQPASKSECNENACTRPASRPPSHPIVQPSSRPTQVPANNSSNGNYYQCPQCNQLATTTCGCQFKDSTCPNGHQWYKAPNGTKQYGVSPNHQ